MLALRVLGGFQVVLEGQEVSELTAQRSRAAFLVYLAMEGSTTRDAVVGVFWPEHEAPKARHALSQTLHRLRGALGEDWLETEGERLGAAACVQIDARRFEGLVEAGEFEEALALYGGPFLAGWFLADGPEFERWVDQQRARLERLHRHARREAIRVRRERGDLSEALRMAQDWAEIDPLEDEAQHRLIELLAESGRRADALQQFELYGRFLEKEGLTPLDETLDLVGRLRQADDVGPLEDVNDPKAPREEPGVEPARARTARPVARSRRLGVGGWTIAVLAALVAAVLLGRRVLPGVRGAEGALAPGARLVLADFGNDTRDSLVAGVVTEALRIDLERYLHSSLVDPAEIARVLARMQRSPFSALPGDTAREVALRAGVPAVVDGRVGAVGPGFVLSAWVLAAEDGRVLDAALATAADSTELLDAIESLSAQLREIVRPAVSALPRPVPLAQVTTSSLEALRRYGRAIQAWRQRGDGVRAVRLLEEATALDSTFAMADRARATVLMNMGHDRHAWIEALSDAYRHRDRLSETERYLTVANYHQSATGDLGRAIDAYEDLLARDSMQVTALNNLGVLYRDLRDFDRAETFLRRCLAVDSLSLSCGVNLAGVVHALGRPAEAHAISEANCRRFPDNPFALSQPGWMAAAEHDYALADSLFADLTRFDLPNPGALEVWLAQVDMVRGRVEEARRHLANGYRIARGSERSMAAAALQGEAWLELEIRRDTARALAAMDSVLRDPVLAEMDSIDVPYLDIADFYVDAGRTDRAEAMLEAFLTDVPVEWRQPMERWLYAIRGRLAMEADRLAEAREAFQVADAYPGSPFIVLQYLGPLEERAGRPDAAIAAYERYLSTATLDRLIYDAVLLPGVLERLGQLHEAAGHARVAAAYYTRFADLWAGADAELQPRVEEARRRARALMGGEGGAE